MRSVKLDILSFKWILILILVNASNIAIAQVISTTGSSPSAVSATYGTASLSTSFMVSGANMAAGILVIPPAEFEVSKNGIDFFNTETIGASGTITSTQVFIRLKKTAAAATYSGNIVLRSTNAPDVNVAMPASTVDPLIIDIGFYADRPYGTILKDTVLKAPGYNFTIFNSYLKNGETVSSVDVAFSAGHTGKDPVGIYNNALQPLNMTGSNGFLPSNYIINYRPGPVTIEPAFLVITAKSVTKLFGDILTDVVGSTEFTVTGLQNGETINTVDITYGSGAKANAIPGIYNTNAPSAAVGGNGFLLSNYNIMYLPGRLTVLASTGPIIKTTGNPSVVNTTYGTPSSSTSFTVSGANMTKSILVTPPAGFEVSLDDNVFSTTVTIPGTGTIASKKVYIRLKGNTPAGIYFGDIVLSSDSTTVNVGMPNSTVNRADLRIVVSDTKIYGETLTDFIEISNGSNFSDVNAALKNGETASTLTITYTAGYLTTAAVGTYPNAIQASNLTGTFLSDNYTITYVPGNVTVMPAPLLATADNKSKLYGDPNPPLTIIYTGFVNGEDAAQLTTQPIVATTATQGSDAGVYPITVSGGSSPNYIISYVSGTLTVFKDISIPNTFTPNGDGINDTWSISNLNPNLKITVEIMNRYGTRVYSSSSNSVSWDGYSNGVPVPFGVYYYVIKGVKQKPITGYITVVR